jgi:para-nitrobenzyl esterase
LHKQIALAASLAVLAGTNVSAAPSLAAPRATIAQGAIVGTTEQGVATFLSIPFAQDTGGAARWTAPKPVASWGAQAKTFDKYGAACPQALAPPGGKLQWTDEFMHPANLGISEDCLHLNLWTPADLSSGRPAKADLPVLVYIYGGGFVEGSNAVAVYNGANVAKKGVIVVAINYRVGPLGFLAHPELSAENGGASGNWGIQDQIAALRWIRDNIASFGGDASKVTIQGQSAGAMSVHALIASPEAKGLFRGAIVEAGGIGGTFGPLATAEETGKTYLQNLGAASIAAARATPLDRIMATTTRGGVVMDGKVIPKGGPPTPAASDVPVLIGANLNEGGVKTVTAAAWKADVEARYGARAAEMLKLYPAGSDAEARNSAEREAADRTFLTYQDFVARRASAKPVYAYQFTQVLPGPKSAEYGAFHTSELPYVMNSLHLTLNRNITDVDRRVGDQTATYWANFVKTGNPNGAGLPQWPAFSQSAQVMNLGDKPGGRTPAAGRRSPGELTPMGRRPAPRRAPSWAFSRRSRLRCA